MGSVVDPRSVHTEMIVANIRLVQGEDFLLGFVYLFYRKFFTPKFSVRNFNLDRISNALSLNCEFNTSVPTTECGY